MLIARGPSRVDAPGMYGGGSALQAKGGEPYVTPSCKLAGGLRVPLALVLTRGSGSCGARMDFGEWALPGAGNAATALVWGRRSFTVSGDG